MRFDVAPARFYLTHMFSQFVLNSDLNTDVNLEFTRMMTPPPLLSVLSRMYTV